MYLTSASCFCLHFPCKCCGYLYWKCSRGGEFAGNRLCSLCACPVTTGNGWKRDKVLCDKAVSSIAFLPLVSPCSLLSWETLASCLLWISHICTDHLLICLETRAKLYLKSCLITEFLGRSHHPHSLERRWGVPQEQSQDASHGEMGPASCSPLPRGRVLHRKLNVDLGEVR